MVFTIFGYSFVKKIKNKVFLGSIKSLTNCEHLSSNPLQGAVLAFQKEACDSKNRSESSQ
jgi:hypothetical protein